VVLLLNVNNAQKHILFIFFTLWFTLYPTVSFFSCLQKIDTNVGEIVQSQIWRRFLHSLTAVSIMLCS